MTPDSIRAILDQVETGALTAAQALERLKVLPFEDIGFARVDHHRALRKGFPEVIFCERKTAAQVRDIARVIVASGNDLLGTRVLPDQAAAVCEAIPGVKYNEVARTVSLRQSPTGPRVRGEILVVCAGTSDLSVAEEAVETATVMGHPVSLLTDVGVAGLHRLLVNRNRLDAASVIIVVAGMEGALPSVIGGLVDVPVIAVPTSVGYGAHFAGVAALLGMLNSCATGVTVVNIDNGFGAAAAACLMNRERETLEKSIGRERTSC